MKAKRKTAKKVAKRRPSKPRDIDAAGYQALLAKLGACSEARHEAEGKSMRRVWDSCERGDWLLWLSAKLRIDRKLIVLAACDCARTALRFVPAGETRPREAIETAEAWCRGEATINQVRDAAHAAYAAAHAADQKQCAGLVRARIPFDVILTAANAAGA